MLICGLPGALQPLRRSPARPFCVGCPSNANIARGRGQNTPLRPVHCPRPVLLAKARTDPTDGPEEPRPAHEGAFWARQLLSVTVLAACTLAASVAKERATSPIIPPLLPTLTAQTDAGATSGVPPAATAVAERPDREAASSVSKAAAKPSRSLLRALWGTATLPVKLVDSLLFPEEALVGSSKPKQAPAASSPAAEPAAALQASTAASADAPSSALPAADPAAAAAGQALTSLGQQVEAVAAAARAPNQGSAPEASSTPEFLVRLQQAVARMAQQQQQQQEGEEQDQEGAASSSAAGTADAAATLAALRLLLGPDAMSLLPVVLVTSASAAAGLMLAASIAGVAGLVDRKRVLSPAQRAAEAALLDSPLRPISCPTMPGFLPMLPPSMEPVLYRWTDADAAPAAGAAAAAGDSSSEASSKADASGVEHHAAGAEADTATAAAAGGGAVAVKEHPLDQEWWSFAQIAALRMMPLLPRSAASSSSSSSSSGGSSASTAPAASAAAAAAPAGSAPAEAAPTSGSSASSAATFDEAARRLAAAAKHAMAQGRDRLKGRSGGVWDNSGMSVLLGDAWDTAVRLALVDTMGEPDTSWEVARAFGSTAPAQLLAEACCLLPAAVVCARNAAGMSAVLDAERVAWGEAGSGAAGWEQATRLLATILGSSAADGEPAHDSRLQEVCEAMGCVGTRLQPQQLHGVLQQHCEQLGREVAEQQSMQELVWGEVPDAEAWLQQGKRMRVEVLAAAVRSSVMAAHTVMELWGEVAASGAPAAAHTPAAAAAASRGDHGTSWLQPRLMLRHGWVMRLVLDSMCCEQHLPGTPGVVQLAADLLSRSAFGCRVAVDDLLVERQAGPPGCRGYSSSKLHSAPAPDPDTLRAKVMQQGTDAMALALGAVCSAAAAWQAAAATHGKPVEINECDVEEDVLTALRWGVLVVKPEGTAVPFKLRPEWPAALQLAQMDSLLLPSQSAELLDAFMDMLERDEQLVARMVVLLPAALAHSRRCTAALAAEFAAGSSAAPLAPNRESVTAACQRMCSALVWAGEEHGVGLNLLLVYMGLQPSAVWALVVAAEASGSTSAAAAAAAAAADDCSSCGQQVNMLYEGDLLMELHKPQPDGIDAELADAVLLSFAVALAMLLQLDLLDTDAAEPALGEAAEDVCSPRLRWLPPEVWAGLVQRCSEAGVFALPAGLAVAAVLEGLLVQTQHKALQASVPGLDPMPAEAFATACEQLRAIRVGVARSSGSGRGGRDPEPVPGSELWEQVLADAVQPWGQEFGGDEWWLERDDLQQAVLHGQLHWRDSLSDEEEDEREEGEEEGCGSSDDEAAAGDAWEEEREEQGGEEQGEEAAAEGEEEGEEGQGWASRSSSLPAGVPHASAHASWEDEESWLASQGVLGELTEALMEDYWGEQDELDHPLGKGWADTVLQDLATADLGMDWQAAVVLVLVDHMVEGGMVVSLQDFACSAPAADVAELCALLPAAAASCHAAVGDAYWAESSWDTAARLVAALLTPVPIAPEGAASCAGDGGASKATEVCGHLGLYWDEAQHGYGRIDGVLQRHAQRVLAAHKKQQQVEQLPWGPAGAAAQQWLLRPHNEAYQQAGMVLRSSVVASYLAMELWFERDCPLVSDSSGEDEDGAGPQPAVLFSQYALLQQLRRQVVQRDGEDHVLAKHVVGATELAESSSARDISVEEHHKYRLYPGYSTEKTDMLIRNGSTRTRLTGRLPDLAGFAAFQECLWEVQDSMGKQLLLLPQAAAAGGGSAAAAAQLDERGLVRQLAESVASGQQVVPLRCWYQMERLMDVCGPELRAAAQLAVLYDRLPEHTGNLLLHEFAAVVSDRALARVCALLPAAAANYSSTSGKGMLQQLSCCADGASLVPALLPHIGISGAAAGAALRMVLAAQEAADNEGDDTAAAKGARNTAPTGSVPAALEAVRSAGLEVEWAGGFLQDCWQQWASDRHASAAADLLFGSAAVTISVLLSTSHAAEWIQAGCAAGAAAGSDSSSGGDDSSDMGPSGPLLEFEGWMLLAGQFAATCRHPATGRAALAALLQQGVQQAQAREGVGALPAAFRQQLDQGLPYHDSSRYNVQRSSALRVVPQDWDWEDGRDQVQFPAGCGLARRAEAGAAAAAGAQATAEEVLGSATLAAAEGTDREGEGRGLQSGSAAGDSLEEEYAGDYDEPTAAAAEEGGGAVAAEGEVTADNGKQQELAAGRDSTATASKEFYGGAADPSAGFRGFGWAGDSWATATQPQIPGDSFLSWPSPDGWLSSASPEPLFGAWGASSPAWDLQEGGKGRGQQGKGKKKRRGKNKNKGQQQQQAAQQLQQGSGEVGASSTAAWEAEAAGSSNAAAPVAGEPEEAGRAEAAAGAGGGSEAELVPSVKTLLGLPADPSDSASGGDLVPNRLALLMCQAMLMRGDDAAARLQAAVGFLATAQAGASLQLPLMLAGCMEALFTSQDWDSASGSARQVLSSLSTALPPASYVALQQHLMAKGLLRELEVPAEFE